MNKETINEALHALQDSVVMAMKYCHEFEKVYQVNMGKSLGHLETAIEALEKQVLKKPVKAEYMNLCPNCYSCEIELLLDGGFTETRFKYCPNCGQALDWSEEE